MRNLGPASSSLRLLSAFWIAFFCGVAIQAQTYTGASGPIHDVSVNDIPLVVTGLTPSSIDTIGFGLETVCINLVHTWDGDLDIKLVSPDGTTITLASGLGGGGHDYANTCFNENAPTGITQSSPPFTGTFYPQGQMGIVNNQQNGNGTWFLRVTDMAGQDTGYVYGWSITFGNNPASYYSVSATDLPLVIINTNGQGIPNDPKITAHMGIIDNGVGNLNHVSDPFNGYDGWIGIETRGNSSQSFPQKQYSFETRTVWGDNLDTTLLGMPEDHDWILYGGYSDKSIMRNWLSYELSNDMGRYAVRGRYCEVILDGSYQGIYEITESISRGNDRVDIAKMTHNDIFGDALTGGYMAKIDWIGGPSWQSNFLPDQTGPSSNVINFQLIYPKPADIVPAQQAYFEAYVDSFEQALFGPMFADTTVGWRNFADESSFVDYFILNELAKNVDAYWLSTYFYKDKNSKGGKITMGPSWDFNGAWHGADYCNAPDPADWHFNEPSYCSCDMPMWWKRLIQSDTLFANKLQCRWTDLRSTVLDTTHIFHLMDSAATLLSQAQVRHFRQWPILGVYTWPNPSPLALSHQEEIANTKAWIIDRLAWIDANLPGICYPPVVGTQEASLLKVSVYPNPNQGDFQVRSERTIEVVTVTDVLGKVILRMQPQSGKCVLHLDQAGIYFVAVEADGLTQVQKVTVTR